MIVDAVKSFCLIKCYKLVSILQINKAKKTAVVEISHNSNELIAKICFDKKQSADLQNEILFYNQNLNNSNIPKLFSYGIDDDITFIVFSKIRGTTLLEFCVSNSITNEKKISTIDLVITHILNFNDPEDFNIDKYSLVKELRKKFNVLLFSGPAKTSRNSFFYCAVVRLFYFCIGSHLNKVLLGEINKLEKSGFNFGSFFHGDLHLNNVIVNEDYFPIIIDFEKSNKSALMLVDLCFFIAVANIKLSYFSLPLYLEQSRPRVFNSCQTILQIFCEAAKVNPRFNNTNKFSFSNLVSIYRALKVNENG